MKIYLETFKLDNAMARISEALIKYLPAGNTITKDPNEADLVVIFAYGHLRKMRWHTNRLITKGKKYAVIQLSVRSTSNPNTADWLPLWEKAQTTWSYYDLYGMCKEDGNDPKFNFYFAPLGVDSEIFKETPSKKTFIIAGTGTGRGWNKECKNEICYAASKINRPIFHLGTGEDDKQITYSNGMDDRELAKNYSKCEFVSGLHLTEGFELPVLEGLLCGARPVCFDIPCYKHWFNNIAEFVPSKRSDVVNNLTKLFERGAKPVSDDEKEFVKRNFDWKTICEGFWKEAIGEKLIQQTKDKTEESMLGKWNKWYSDDKLSKIKYGDTTTYKLASEFLKECDSLEDWGCGVGGFREFYKGKYLGIDGTKNPHVDKVFDLRNYRSNPEGVLLRHVLEHNNDWEQVLTSFEKKLCIVIFTPFADKTHEIAQNKKFGVDVPDISFRREDIENKFRGLIWRCETIKTASAYGLETIYYLEKPPYVRRDYTKKIDICVTTARLGGFDFDNKNVPQSIPAAYAEFTDENFPPRIKSMQPRLQAKIPKCFAWELIPGYDYYLWLDGNIVLNKPDSIQYFLDQCQEYDVVVFKHQKRPDIRQETRYTRKGVKQGRLYLTGRYKNEFYNDIYKIVQADKDYTDNLLVNGGVFMYKNIPKVQAVLKEWWYFITRYAIQDQLSFIYVLRKGDLKIKVIDEDVYSSPYLSFKGHVKRISVKEY